MLEETTRLSLSKALEDLREDLKKKLEKVNELESLRKECEGIQALIRQIEERLVLKSLLPDIDLFAEIPEQGLGLNEQKLIEKPIIEGVDEIYDEFKRTKMKLKEIISEFRMKGWKLSKDNPQESIRSALKKHPNRYKKVGRGIWQKIRTPKTLSLPKPTSGLLHDESKEVAT
jgi:hypothetical protein